jgi:3-oxoacyl-[acyl-carrier-protein] synthase-1
MRKTFVAGDNIITSLGFSTTENFQNLIRGNTGVKVGNYSYLCPEAFPASLVNKDILEANAIKLRIEHDFTVFEQLLISSITDSLKNSSVEIKSPKTRIVLSSTKGNIDLLKNNPGGFNSNRVHLWKSAQVVGDYFQTSETPMVISNACVSGVLALNTANRLIKQGKYDTVIVAGCDILSEFIVSGFQTFLSLSKEVCKPFDKERSGLSLGEGAATVILTSEREKAKQPYIEIVAGSGSNDANHISGPSRTGEGLYIAIKDVLKGSMDIDFISAHGTATAYNDDMESIALTRNNLNNIPVNSFKGYIGHTLGAAGLIESIFCFESMRQNLLIKTFGFESPGTTEKINVIRETKAARVNKVLKTASGFGGSNAVILFEKLK